jgi:hypothetical protein
VGHADERDTGALSRKKVPKVGRRKMGMGRWSGGKEEKWNVVAGRKTGGKGVGR